MSKLRAAIFLALMLLVVILTISCFFPSGKEDPVNTRLPTKLDHRVELSEDHNGRFVEYYSDKVTPKHSLVDLQNGYTKEEWFSKNGKSIHLVTRYPSKSPGQAGQVRTSTKFRADGESFLSEDDFYENGTKFKVGRSEGEGKYKRLFYWPDESLRRTDIVQKIGEEWRIVWAEILSEKGKIIQTIRTADDGKATISFLETDGTLKAILSVTSAQEKETHYFKDGKTPFKVIIRDAFSVNVSTYSIKGRLLEERTLSGPFGGRGMEVLYYDDSGRKKNFQMWFSRDGGIGMNLLGVAEYFPNGMEKRIVTFDYDKNESRFVDSEIHLLDDRAEDQPSIARYFNADNRLLREVHVPGDLKPEVVKVYDDGKGPKIKVRVSPHLLIWKVYDPPPEPLVIEEAPGLPEIPK